MIADEIDAWLSQIKSAIDLAREVRIESTKRDTYTPLSPPISTSGHRKRSSPMSTVPIRTPKRQRTTRPDDGDANSQELEETPRASSSSQVGHQQGRLFQPTIAVPSFPPPSESQGTSASQTSGRGSPTKTFIVTELDPGGIEKRILSSADTTLPRVLRRLLSEISKASNGFHILSRDLKDEIDCLKEKDEFGEFSEVEDFAYVDPQTRDAFGSTPSLEDVESLVEEARECQRTMQDEAGWNISVHYPLLFKAIHGRRRRSQSVGVAPCTTAKIIKEYLPLNTQAKMVDFCMFICPETDSQPALVAETIRQRRLLLPGHAINHTECPAFRNRPVSVSIETKKQGGTGKEDAELQLGTWYAAQWNFLEAQSSSLDGLDFLPAVVVRGHEWSFVATTREGMKTILWVEKPFGSTTSGLGVYKVVWTLQRLAKWSKEVYWPWYKKNLLGIS